MFKKILIVLGVCLVGFTIAMSKEDASEICKTRMDAYLELVKTNEEVALTAVVAMTLMAKVLEDPSEAPARLLNMIHSACVADLRKKERI
jgi:hypothetical protein